MGHNAMVLRIADCTAGLVANGVLFCAIGPPHVPDAEAVVRNWWAQESGTVAMALVT
jgi:hypothetical protein